MADAAIVWADTGGDISITGGDLLADDGLTTAVVLSLFLDRQALSDDELPQGGTDVRGWWADAWAKVDKDMTGSRLWLLWRRKQVPEVLEEAREYAEEALAWLVEDGVATRVSVATSYPSRGVLQWDIRITSSGNVADAYTFNLRLEN